MALASPVALNGGLRTAPSGMRLKKSGSSLYPPLSVCLFLFSFLPFFIVVFAKIMCVRCWCGLSLSRARSSVLRSLAGRAVGCWPLSRRLEGASLEQGPWGPHHVSRVVDCSPPTPSCPRCDCFPERSSDCCGVVVTEATWPPKPQELVWSFTENFCQP